MLLHREVAAIDIAVAAGDDEAIVVETHSLRFSQEFHGRLPLGDLCISGEPAERSCESYATYRECQRKAAFSFAMSNLCLTFAENITFDP